MTKTREKLTEIGEGLSIWRVHIDFLREQEKNARVMSSQHFNRLVQNIQKEGRLESLPLTVPHKNPAGNDEFLLVSGHHRTRAARQAGVLIIPIIVMEGLTKDQVLAKQLAHNALQGGDNSQILAEIYREIEDLDAKIESGILPEDLEYSMKDIGTDDIMLNLDYELLQILFLPEEKEDFLGIIDMIQDHGDVLVAELPVFKRFKKAMREVGRKQNVRNISNILYEVTRIIKRHYAQEEQGDATQGDNNPNQRAD